MVANRSVLCSEALHQPPPGHAEPVSVNLRASHVDAASADQAAFFSLSFGVGRDRASDARRIGIPLRQLGDDARFEIWSGPTVIGQHFAADLAIVASADHVVVHAEAVPDSGAGISAITRVTYLELLAQVRKLGYPHVYRIWNFVPAINSGSGDTETYARFNAGRAEAYDQLALHHTSYPATTAVGSPVGSPFSVVLLASRAEPVAVENPRQISAYHYPRQYGPRSPAFARAMLLPTTTGATLFISGTASIVGHQSRHADITAQLTETLANIDELLQTSISQVPGCAPDPRGSWRVYLRNPDDRARAEVEVDRRLGGRDQAVYLQADICRRELLVEIEGVCELTTFGAVGT
jgi:chorismate lyase/3-hydroxybenzoate synthase